MNAVLLPQAPSTLPNHLAIQTQHKVMLTATSLQQSIRQSANKMVQQLVSLAENFGKLQKVLLLSPLFFQTRPDDSQALKQFLKYCGSHQVKLCRNKTELLALSK